MQKFISKNLVTRNGAFLVIFNLNSLFLWSFCFGQQSSSHFFTELAIGPSAPVGKFAKKQFVLDNSGVGELAGIAKMGPAVSLTAGYFLTPRTGLLLIIGGAKNRQDAQPIREALQRDYPNFHISVDTKAWITKHALLGIFLRDGFKGASGFSYRLSLAGGINETTVPSLHHIIFNPLIGGAESHLNKRKLPLTFAFAASAGLHYALNQKWNLQLQTQYFQATPSYRYTYNPNFPDRGSADVKRKYPVRAINLLTGIGMRW